MRYEYARWIIIVVTVVGGASLLAACASIGPHITQPEHPPSVADLANLPDPQPRVEPPSATGNPDNYVIDGRVYHVRATSYGYDKHGLASWYGPKFQGRRTSSGKIFNMYALTAASKTLPIPTYVRVTRLDTGKSIVVKVNDRGPFVDGRLIDLSYAAAIKLGMVDQGTVPVEVKALPPYQTRGPGAMLASGTMPSADQQPTAPPAATAPAQAMPDAVELAALQPGHNPPHAVLASASPYTGDVFLQVGAFSQRVRAEELRRMLHQALRRRVEIDSSGDDLCRVRVGPLSGMADVDRTRLALEELGIQKVYLIRD